MYGVTGARQKICYGTWWWSTLRSPHDAMVQGVDCDVALAIAHCQNLVVDVTSYCCHGEVLWPLSLLRIVN